MINQLGYSISKELLTQAQLALPSIDFKLTINRPTGNFFYDEWEIKEDFKNTIWEEILNSLPFAKGEARLIKLVPGQCYWAHADIDDRWHMSIVNEKSYLVDLTTEKMFSTEPGLWYTMNAGRTHSAVNFGGGDRVQLVVRQLLTAGVFDDAIKITIIAPDVSNARYVFDQIYSPWLNVVNKLGAIKDFTHDGTRASFILKKDHVDSLPQDFTIIKELV